MEEPKPGVLNRGFGRILLAFPMKSSTTQSSQYVLQLGRRKWGVTNGDLRGVWPPFLKPTFSGLSCPLSAFFRHFPKGANSTRNIQETQAKGLFTPIQSGPCDFTKSYLSESAPIWVQKVPTKS